MTGAPNNLFETPECLDALIEALRFLLPSPGYSHEITKGWQMRLSNGRAI